MENFLANTNSLRLFVLAFCIRCGHSRARQTLSESHRDRRKQSRSGGVTRPILNNLVASFPPCSSGACVRRDRAGHVRTQGWQWQERLQALQGISHHAASRPRESMMDAHQMIAAAALHCSVSTTSPTAALVSGSLPARQGCRSRGRQFTLSPRHARNVNALLRKETSSSSHGRRYLRITEYD